ncbi:MAG: hypothetical protein H7A23_21560 [Leptospiraceae bacterium]|nr:hypothetical protein [Leptospiraceae bacterium]MCP5497151.1 hypothetical protein [Leptospiraceae bacterium]
MYILGDILIWPKADADTVMTAIFFIIVTFSILSLTNWLYRKQLIKKRLWDELYEKAVRRGLTQKEINIIKDFYKKLGQYHLENVKNIDADENFKKLLFNNLSRNKDIPIEYLVKILDKFFAKNTEITGINNLADLNPGEACGLEFSNGHQLGKLLKSTDIEALISIPGWQPSDNIINSNLRLYVYRAGVGGFVLHGKIKKAIKGGLIFAYDEGNVEAKGEEHLMAFIKKNITFTNWQVSESGTKELQLTEDESKKVRINAITEKISDRAVVFRLIEELDQLKLKEEEIWEGSFDVLDGYTLQCRGRIMTSKIVEGNYIFKFLDATEEDRKIVFHEIRKNNPVRENLS